MKPDKALPLIAVLALALIATKTLTSPVVAPDPAIHMATDDTFDALLTRDPPLKVVEFGATWCRPCRKLQPELNKLAGWMPKQLAVIQVDTDHCPAVAADHRIASLPTLILYRGEEILGRTQQPRHLATLQDWVRPHLPTAEGTP